MMTSSSFVREPEGTLAYALKHYDQDKIDSILKNLILKTKPKNHQALGLILGMMKNTWLFALDPGLGKTKLALDIITNRRELDEVNKTLVVCPPIVINHWGNEIKKHSELTSNLIVGNSNDKVELFMNGVGDITVISLPWITRQFARMFADQKILQLFINKMSTYDMIVFDEVHLLRNAKSKGFRGFKIFLDELQPKYVYSLTGTPVGNDFTGLWALYYLLDGGRTYGANYGKFLSTWFNSRLIKHRFLKHTLKSDKRKDFTNKFWNRAIRWEESECNDLPEKRKEIRQVIMTGEQREDYELTLKNLPKYHNKKEFNREASMFELMRITAGIGYKESPKIDATLEYVNDICISMNRPLLIWHWLDKEGELLYTAICKKYKQLRVGCIRGAISYKNKEKELSLWKERKLDVMIANTKSLGVGVDLFEANTAIFFSNNFSLIDRKQAEKRIHRTGQTRKCRYIDIVCENTIDEVVLQAVKKSNKEVSSLTRDVIFEKAISSYKFGN